MSNSNSVFLMIWAFLFAFFIGEQGVVAQSASGDEDPFQAALKSIVGRPDSRSDLTAEEYIRILALKLYDAELIDELVEKLGSTKYTVRQSAHRQLCTIPILPVNLEQLAESTDDPEKQWRFLAILKTRSATDERLLKAALASVEQRKVESVFGWIKLLVDAKVKPHLKNRYRAAFLASVNQDDKKVLVEYTRDDSELIRGWSAASLRNLFGKDSLGLIRHQLDDVDERVRLDAAALLLDLGHRPAMDALVKLLESDDSSIRSRSWQIIRIVTAQNFGHLPYTDIQKRAKAIGACQEWLAKNGETFELQIPLSQKAFESSVLQGNTLIAINGKLIREYDIAKKKVFQVECEGVGGVDKTVDGTYVVHSYTNKYLREIDATGKTLWEITDLGFNNSVITDSGNVLVTIGTNKLVREYDRITRDVVWEKKLGSWTNDAVRMPNGNTLVAEHAGVVELDPKGEEVWRYNSGDHGTCVACKALSNGNVLIGWTKGVVKEINREKETVWEKKNVGYVHDMFRDENGNTIIMSQKDLKEYDTEGNVVWEVKKGEEFGTVRR